MSFRSEDCRLDFVEGLKSALRNGRRISEASIKWKGNVQENPTQYFEELSYYFKTLGIEEDRL